MTLPGGPADKLGNRYEKWWTVSECVRMLHGDTEAIRIEDPGVEKAEFVVTAGSRRELHQAKRSHPSGKWSLAALRADGLLRAIGEQLAGNSDRFVFVSGSDARELSELCESACHAESVEEFGGAFLAAVGRKELFERLLRCWACDVPTAFERLRRVDVRTIDERGLEQMVRFGVQALFVVDPGKVLAELRRIVEDSVHRTIRRRELVEQLAGRGYRLRHLRNPEDAGGAVETATNRYLDGARRKLIQQTLVPRAAAGTLLSRLEGTSTDSVMTGRAGSGKTACVVEVVEALRARGLPVLAFRLDRVVEASTTTDLGSRLDLEESPVLVLAAAAETIERPGVLVIDQLDAVSTMSGRSSDAFDLVERLLHEARGLRERMSIHTVVVCRAFDWKNDPRLRRLLPDSQVQVDVTEFTVDEVKTILVGAGFDPALFRERQLNLLRLPQNLSLFLEAGFNTSYAPAFGTATELFDRYWTEKRQSAAARVAPLPDQWMEVMEILCDEMTSSQQLSVPREKLDGVLPAYLHQLASEGVLTFDGRRYGFGHESFFDYCFARASFNRSEPLVSFLKGTEQHLFRRAQVRQALAYLRDADPARYVQELGGLLSDDGIRTHFKDLAFALLAEVTDPTAQEWAIWESWIAPALKAIEEGTPDPDKLSAMAWRRLSGSRSWFTEVDRLGLIEHWLASESDRIIDNVAVDYLRVHQKHSPDRIAALLELYADHGGEWARRLRFLMEWADHHSSRRFYDLFLHLVDNGTLDEARGPIVENSTFWSMLHDLGKNRPEWVPEVLAHRLRRRLVIIRDAGEDVRNGKFLGYDRAAADLFEKSAEHAPAEFVHHLLPIVLEISDLAQVGDEPPKRDTVWSFLVKTRHPSATYACLSGLAGALAALACEGAAGLHDTIAALRRRDTHVANHLLLALYAGGVARYADEAIAVLCDEPWRFQCGFSDSPNWCVMELIQTVVPQCTVENRDRIESVILNYVSPHERTRIGYKQIGRTRFALLSVIPAALRSARANAHFEELERKFGEPEGEPLGIVGGFIRSPIGKSATDRMTDDQWLSAIVKFRSEHPPHSPRDDLKGGALELARVLEARVKEEPDRFVRLSLRIPTDSNPMYLERTLAALKSAAVASDLKLQVCSKAFAESRGPCGQSIADVLGSIEDPLPDDAIQMLHWLATEHEDPSSEAWQEDAGGGQTYYNGDILMNGINTTRGRAADAIRDLIANDAAYIDRFRATLGQVIRDPNASVLSCVAGTLRAVAHRDRALGMSLFRTMNLSEDRLLATHFVYEFIRAGLRDNFAELRPIVKRMLRSPEPEVCEAGARLASITALSLRVRPVRHGTQWYRAWIAWILELTWRCVNLRHAAVLVDEALWGSTSQRLGVAQVASANITVPECRTWSETKLTLLFDDDDAVVRREAASCFRELRDEPLDTYGDLIAAFCDSRAYREDSFSILHALEASLERLPGMTCVVCEKFFDRFDDEAWDVQNSRIGDVLTIAKLIFRTYQQHQNDEWTTRSLDLIDRLCLERITEARAEFEQFER